MSNIERKLKLAFNPCLIDKNVTGDRSLFAVGFENVECTPGEFAAGIQRGWAYCAQLTGSRNTKNFLACDIVSVDIDDGLTIEAALAHPLVKEHALLLYTTVRHTATAHRFRLVFALPRTIRNARQMVVITRSLTRKLGGDPAAVDATRISYGNRNAEVHRVDREVSAELLHELLTEVVSPHDAEIGSDVIISGQSWIKLERNQEIRLANGQLVNLVDVPAGAAVHCPVHRDERASAFVLKSRQGITGVHCSACAKSYWSGPDEQEDFDFDDFVKAAKQAAALGEPMVSGHDTPMTADATAPNFQGNCNIQIVSGIPAPSDLLPGVTLVRSPKGSGKTESLKRLMAKAKKPLLIGHRRTLIRGSCIRLGLSCYLDQATGGVSLASKPLDDQSEGVDPLDLGPEIEAFDARRFFGEVEDPQPLTTTRFTRDRYGICLDSLLQIRPDDGYDLIILDEAEQVLRHILSDTLTGRNLESRVFTLLTELVRRAKYIIALDADLGWVTYNTIARMVSNGVHQDTGRPGKSLYLWINDAPPPGQKNVQLYASEAHLVADLIQAIVDGKRCFVASNSKTQVHDLTAAIRDKFGDTRRVIAITADTGPLPEVKDYVENAVDRTPTYDVILCSPSLGTGVDLTFPGNAVVVDIVFGFCRNGINTHFDFDQQIARVRHPGAIKVWVGQRRFRYETHIDVVRLDLLRAGLHKDLLVGFDADGKPRFSEDDPLIEMAALVRANERASKNNLRGHFVRYREAQGCTIENVGKNADQIVAGSAVLAHGRYLRREEIIAKVIASVTLPRPDFERIRHALEAGHVVTEKEVYAHERTRMELFYRRPVTPDLIRLDDGGRHRRRVLLFEQVTRLSPNHIRPASAEQLHDDLRFIRAVDDDVPSAVVRLLWLTPLWGNVLGRPAAGTEGLRGRRGKLLPMPVSSGQAVHEQVGPIFDPDVVFDVGDLQDFARYVLANKGAVENLLDHEVRKDVVKKSMQQLGLVLKMMGLRLARAGTVVASGKKVYRYRLDPISLQAMMEIAAAREQKKGWACIAELYGSHMNPSEYEGLGLDDDDEWTALEGPDWVGPDDDDWPEVEASIRRAQEFARRTTKRFS